VVVIARHVARVTVHDGAGPMTEAVPDRLPATIHARGALDLVGGRLRAEAEARGQREHVPPSKRSGRGHPFTAPAVMPLISQRWVMKKAMSTGSVEITPAAMSCAVLSW